MLGRTVAGKYRIDAHLGSGSMGEVFRARHVVLDSPVALKIMQADLAKDDAFKERFYREARAASRLEHPNSVRVLDFGEETDGLVYLAMELLGGRDLFAVVREDFPLTDARIVHIMSQTLSALAVAHELGIVHRDLKPENIMVSRVTDEDGQPRDEVKVCDFGIAKISDPATFKTQNEGRSLTKTGTLMGTPEYMSPEQARGESLDARSDLYSMGIILYQLLAGRLPFTGDTVLSVVLKQVTDAPVPPSELRKEVNRALESICLRALRKEKSERYQTAREMRADVRAVLRASDPALAFEPPFSSSRLPVSEPDIVSAPTLIAPGAVPTPPSRPKLPEATAVAVPVAAPKARWLIPLVGALALVGGAALFVTLALVGRSPKPVATPIDTVVAVSATPSITATTTAVPVETATLPVAPSAERRRSPLASSSAGPPALLPSGKPIASIALVASAPPVVSAAPPPADFNPSGAFVGLESLTASGVSKDAIAKKMNAVAPQLSECYRTALRIAGAPIAGSASIQMSIDDTGRATTIVVAPPQLGSFQRCAAGSFSGFSVPKSSLDAPSATATQWLKLTL